MTRRFLMVCGPLVAVALCAPAVRGVELYLALGGSDSNPGTLTSPFATFTKAITVANPGDTIWVRGGTYNLASRIRIQKGGAAGAPIKMFAYPGETPILDFNPNPSASDRGIQLEHNWWHIKGLTVQNAPDNGLWTSGSNNIFEQMTLRWNGDSGLQLSGSGAALPANNLILNSDSYENYDHANRGENADGFAAKFDLIGPGNVFRGNRAWGNSDDGWDLWQSAGAVLLEDNWAFANGVDPLNDPGTFAGDGNGFKLGQLGGTHTLNRVIAWSNPHNGIDVNGNLSGVTVNNSVGYNNGLAGGSNFRFDEHLAVHTLRNNVSLNGSVTIYPEINDTFNSWNGIPADANDFVSLSDAIARGPRQADGSLPVSDFLRLRSDSNLINAGVNVGLPFNGTAPDLGAFEAPIPGDYNLDGLVDAADYVVWRDTLATSFPTGYQAWVNAFSGASGAAGVTAPAVPEPAAGALLALLLVGLRRSRAH